MNVCQVGEMPIRIKEGKAGIRIRGDTSNPNLVNKLLKSGNSWSLANNIIDADEKRKEVQEKLRNKLKKLQQNKAVQSSNSSVLSDNSQVAITVKSVNEIMEDLELFPSENSKKHKRKKHK